MQFRALKSMFLKLSLRSSEPAYKLERICQWNSRKSEFANGFRGVCGWRGPAMLGTADHVGRRADRATYIVDGPARGDGDVHVVHSFGPGYGWLCAGGEWRTSRDQFFTWLPPLLQGAIYM